MKVIFYVAATCGSIDFHFIANLAHRFVITSSLTTLFRWLYLLHEERLHGSEGGKINKNSGESIETSGVKAEGG